MGSLGLICGLWADKFDQVGAFQSFVILPLTFLSGVFYSINQLPPIFQTLSRFNPFFYIIDGFRYRVLFSERLQSLGKPLGRNDIWTSGCRICDLLDADRIQNPKIKI